jgi:hypothetical protein
MNRSCLPIRCVLLLLSVLVKPAPGDVIASPGKSAKELAEIMFAPGTSGVTVVDASFVVGQSAQFGTFAQFQFQKLPNTGLVLSSGEVVNVKAGAKPSSNMNGAGDVDLDKVLTKINSKYSSLDAAALLVTVHVSKPVDITLAYVFGSRDFPNDSVGGDTPWPDVFGLFLNGKNVALIGGIPVSVATVYCDVNDVKGGINCLQYIDNIAEQGTSLVGFTKTQMTTLNLPKGTHQIKVAVADGTVDTNRNADAVVFMSFIGAVQAPTMAPVMAPVIVPGTMKMMKMMMT